MEKIYLVIALVIVAFATVGCSNSEIVGIPDGYIDKEEYFDKDGFQDYTDYAKYMYDSKDVITDNKEYEIIQYDDVQNIVGYCENFSKWMKIADRLNEYDFDISIINEGDYFKVETQEGSQAGNDKYDNYSMYFFDVETLTLYYMHNNI